MLNSRSKIAREKSLIPLIERYHYHLICFRTLNHVSNDNINDITKNSGIEYKEVLTLVRWKKANSALNN